jgi:hypothetical protein
MGVVGWLRSIWPTRETVPVATVEVDDRGVTCIWRDEPPRSVAWDELQSVEIVTTDEGPFVEDVFFVLRGVHGDCVVPQEAEGGNALFTRLSALPGFDHEAGIRAMRCTDNARFPCWTREGGTGAIGA